MAGGSGTGSGGGGKITKLLKKVQSIGKSNRRPSRTSSTNSSSRSSSDDYTTSAYANTRISYTDDDYSACSYNNNNKTGPSPSCTVVYVGQSKRRYILSTDVTEHPLFQELIIERESSCGDGVVILVSCEVVLFEHLLWMLQNADPQPAESSVDELADYYACS